MPIPYKIRKQFYSGPEYEARRAKIRDRAGNCCEQCKVPNHIRVDRCNGGWWKQITKRADGKGYEIKWRDEHGEQVKPGNYPATRNVRIKCGMAHLDHDRANNDDKNLAWLCDWCHIHHDVPIHQVHAKETRLTHKDGKRPFCAAGAIRISA